MSREGVTFAGEGSQDLLGNDGKMSAAPEQPSGRGDSLKFADNGGGDTVNVAYGTDKRINVDKTDHDFKSGEGFTPIADNNWTGKGSIPA
jgi:hypothetical protein